MDQERLERGMEHIDPKLRTVAGFFYSTADRLTWPRDRDPESMYGPGSMGSGGPDASQPFWNAISDFNSGSGELEDKMRNFSNNPNKEEAVSIIETVLKVIDSSDDPIFKRERPEWQAQLDKLNS